ncbi:hypothetical protein WJ0W_003149 [Paenibacillus melissococcoides]|uniref:Uncharacterized protein n=1 Tax=Paenibacillus melissococcoides TaxID=2912268 RepID=A0ABM9G2N0_9BACL|nr:MULTISPECIES: hypothetical protein [Paenibacillus]MEB9892261.1 hypothetical protein [Bacillus cereus]CAH8245914.1 hypothetical protein WJ0W_003149 [Paenibacillus melissococcoides]CAH8712450.1 hypothetical protein WDD9_003232 [Paenibacillus melissococcoides]CAH8713196.1 hypothetical protein HTL2_003535 [Paenibacillus melissococcoides]GIO77539.1 hypothetical protein J6TS7_11490 [Paenibacillus dendritiformis]
MLFNKALEMFKKKRKITRFMGDKIAHGQLDLCAAFAISSHELLCLNAIRVAEAKLAECYRFDPDDGIDLIFLQLEAEIAPS